MKSPNLLFIVTDEQRFDTLACYGNDQLMMPNLNALAARSCVVEEAYCTQPVCTPARGSFMTGLFPHAHGAVRNNVPLNPDARCLPEYLPADYATAYHGKWHLGDEVFAQHGFDAWRSVESTWENYNRYFSPGRDPRTMSSYHHFLRESGFKPDHGQDRTRSTEMATFSRDFTTKLPESYGKPAYLAREAQRFLRERAQQPDDPFALYVSILEPHMPFYGPRDHQYDPLQMPLPENFDAIPGEGDPLHMRLRALRWAHEGFERYDLSTEMGWRQMQAAYWGLCSLVDTHIGTILDTLDTCGLMDNTLIVFTADHGDMMGSHRLLGKGVMYQESVRVPLLIHFPGQTEQRRVTGPFSQVDLVPTLLDAMGQPVPTGLHGTSRHALLENGGAFKEDVFITWHVPEPLPTRAFPDYVRDIAGNDARASAVLNDPVRTIITPDGWRFTYSPAGDHTLFNLNNDREERYNLAKAPEYQPQVQALTARIAAWQARVGDTYRIQA